MGRHATASRVDPFASHLLLGWFGDHHGHGSAHHRYGAAAVVGAGFLVRRRLRSAWLGRTRIRRDRVSSGAFARPLWRDTARQDCVAAIGTLYRIDGSRRDVAERDVFWRCAMRESAEQDPFGGRCRSRDHTARYRPRHTTAPAHRADLSLSGRKGRARAVHAVSRGANLPVR